MVTGRHLCITRISELSTVFEEMQKLGDQRACWW